ncbi:MAG: substrate-binding domain-containing protein [Prevotella sp.]|nr:substrate-binding domain-containing protein [Prevotella sp.]
MQKLLTSTIVSVLILICLGCSRQQPRYAIGVSQCSEDIWREKQNAEMRMGCYLQDGVKLCFAAAYDSDERQIQQIDSLLKTGIDLLIVAPNQIQTISPAIDRAYDSGIPVIVFERKTNSQKYTAFVSADNYEMGRQMGEYVATRLHDHGNVIEVMGLKGSSPAIERHEGFMEALSHYPNIHVLATLQGDWTEESAHQAVKEWRQKHPDEQIDFVFGQNDRMAIGARKALQESQQLTANSHQPLYCGIDGLPGKDGGVQLVRDSILDATYIYPTHGDQLLQLAIDILEGKPYRKETLLMSALVTNDNAHLLVMQNDEIIRQSSWLGQLHQKADTYLQQLDNQRIITLLACIVIVLLLTTLVFFYRYHLGKMTLRRERVVNTLWNLKPEDVASITPAKDTPEDDKPTEDTESTVASEDTDADSAQELPASASLFITRFKEVVEARLENSELSVEDLAADMNLSRVQLYRKVKAVTGATPVEILRTARLNRGYQLLLTTDKSVSEVAYLVGFTAPSYFTKCFKEEYGKLPGDVRQC